MSKAEGLREFGPTHASWFRKMPDGCFLKEQFPGHLRFSLSAPKTKRPPGNMGGLFLRENSSKRRIPSETFMAESYEPSERGVKKFL